MIHLSEVESLTYITTTIWVPFNHSKSNDGTKESTSRNKGFYFFTINTTQESIADILNNTHDKVSNMGSIYKAYYYDYSLLPKCIKSKKVVNSGLTMAKAKKQRLQYYSIMDSLSEEVLTPLTLSPLSGKNFIYDMNPVIDLYDKQKKIQKTSLLEQFRAYFNTVGAIVEQQIPKYQGNFVFVNLDDYTKCNKKSHILHNIMLLLKRSDKIIGEFRHFKYKIVFYNKKGSFVFDMSKDLIKTNYTKLVRLLTRLGITKVDQDVQDTDNQAVANYITKQAMKSPTSNMTGDADLVSDDDVANAEIDSDDEITKAVSSKVDDVADIDDTMEEPEFFQDEEIKREYNEAIVKKTTGSRSEASLRRDAELREKQKSLKIHNKTIQEITADKQVAVIPTHKVEVDSVTNENIKELRFSEINKTYMETTYDKDVTNAILSLNNTTIPVNIVDIKVEDTSDALTLKETYTVTLEDSNRKRHTLKFNLPKLIDNKYMYVNGNKKTIQEQFYPYPVVKISPSSVQVVTNYQKITINRVGSRFNRNSEKIRKLIEDPKSTISIHNGDNTSINKEYLTCLEYDELAKRYNVINIGNASFVFNAKLLHDEFGGKEKSTLDKILVGYSIGKGSKKEPIYYDRKNPDHVDLVSLMISYASPEVQEQFANMSSGKKYVHNSAVVMKKPIPLIVLLGFFEGLDQVLRKFNDETVKFFDNTKDKRYQYIKFKDGYLGYPLSNMEACLLFNGFTEIPTNAYTISDMNNRDVYLEIFEYLFGSSYVAGALITFYEFMIDAITKEILEILDYPTDLVSLMIFASNLLADNAFDGEVNLRQFRLRRNEIIPVILYKNIARSYSRYRQTANNPNPAKITMDPDAVIKELMALPTVEDYSTLSPMVEVHKDGLASMKGVNGMNLDRSYTLDKRAYDDSMIGIVGISTNADANCGKIRQLVAEPKVLNVRGFMELTDMKDLSTINDSNIITPVEYLTPMSSTHDVAERTAMATKQTGHVIPVENNSPMLVTMGMDQVVHYRTGNDFSVVAKDDGKVIEFDENAQLIVVEYKDKSKQAIDISSHVVKNGGGGFYLANKLTPRIKKGQSFKKDDILAYDPKYYKEQGVLGNRLTLGSLMKVAVISNFSTYEDSSFVTRYMSKQMATNVTMQKHLVISASANIEYIVEAGQEITAGQDLIRYESAYDDAELNRLLASVRDDMKEEIINLGKSSLTSPYTGKIEDVIIYSGVDEEEMSPSIRKIFKKYQSKIKAKNDILNKYSDNKDSVYRLGVIMNKPYKKVEPDQFGKIKGYDVGKGLLIEFYITYHDELSDGDKLAASTANKNTIGYVVPRGYEAYSEFRPYEEISSPVAPSAILQRGTPSVIITGTAYKVLIETKRYLYKLLTGEDYDEILKQKQPWMVHDQQPTKESTVLLPIIQEEEIGILESVFQLNRTDSGYTSNKYYFPDDVVMSVDSSKDYSAMLEKFAIGTPNVYFDDETYCVRALEEIKPNTVLTLYEVTI